MGTSREQYPIKVNVFYSDAERLTVLAGIHQRMLDGETTVSSIRVTYEAAMSLRGIIVEAARLSNEPPRPQILSLVLDEAQTEALRLARDYARRETSRPDIGSVALAS